MVPSILFRGDRSGNQTKPELYRTEGLFTKLINGGNPAYISEAGLIEAIRVHIDPRTLDKTTLQSQSSFLSFSSDRQRALHFASDGNPQELISCKEYTERRYLFSLNIALCKLIKQYGNEVYLVGYDCNYEIIRPNALTIPDIIASRSVRCEFCKDGKEDHRLLLFDVVNFLEKYPSNAKGGVIEKVLEKARLDYEWLVLPVDYIPRLGYSARIPPSLIWQAEHFRLHTEQPKDMASGGIQGIIDDM